MTSFIAQGDSIPAALDRLALRHGVYTTAAVSRRVADPAEAAAMMARLHTTPPTELAGFAVHATQQGDAVFLTGGDQQSWVRVVVRPSGTEPKVKCYTEVRQKVGADLADARRGAAAVQDRLLESIRTW